MKTTYIYALIEPVTREVRYIGKTVAPKERLRYHIYAARTLQVRTYAANWIRGLLAQSLAPEMQILEECSGETWKEREQFWIREYKRESRLTNLTDGGDGMTGWIPTETTRLKWSLANKTRTLSTEAQARIEAGRQKSIATRLGKPHSAETRQKICERVNANKSHLFGNKHSTGRIASAETRLKISLALKGRPLSYETREKLSIAAQGRQISADSRLKMSQTRRKQWANSEFRSKRISAIKNGWAKRKNDRQVAFSFHELSNRQSSQIDSNA